MSNDNYSIIGNDNNQIDDFLDMSMGMGSFERAKDTKKSVKKLLAYSRKYLLFIVVAAILAVVSAVLLLISPIMLKDFTDLIVEGLVTEIDLSAIGMIGITLIFIYFASALSTFAQSYILTTITQLITKRMRTDITRKINKLPIWFYNRNTTGEILSRITNDVDTFERSLDESVNALMTSVIVFVGSLIMMFATNWILAVTAIVTTTINLVAMPFIMSKSQKHFDIQQKYLGNINAHIEECFSGHNAVKVHNGEMQMRETFEGFNKKLQKSTFMAQFLSGLMTPITALVNNLGYVAIMVVGAMLVVSNQISFGVIVAFLVFIRYFAEPFSEMSWIAQGFQIAAAACERVFEFLDAEEMTDESEKTKKIEICKGKVEFKHVKFGYEDSDKIIINDSSATAFPGQKVAIVGPTGAGKTTLVNLLMRFNELKGGEITIDDVPISQMSREEVRSLFCMVLQDAWLFEGTIKENIIYNNSGVSDQEVKNACKAVGVHNFIKTLPKGYDTVLDDKTSISSGQKQQITIARAMIENAPMLILDEATSSVDTRTELSIQKAMDKLMEGRTSFVIAHRLTTIKNADIILVLKDGDIVESGNHRELLAKNGFYAELYNSQFEVA